MVQFNTPIAPICFCYVSSSSAQFQILSNVSLFKNLYQTQYSNVNVLSWRGGLPSTGCDTLLWTEELIMQLKAVLFHCSLYLCTSVITIVHIIHNNLITLIYQYSLICSSLYILLHSNILLKLSYHSNVLRIFVHSNTLLI